MNKFVLIISLFHLFHSFLLAVWVFVGYLHLMQEYPSLVWHLKNTQLFEDLSEDELEQITRITPYKKFSAGEIIYHMEDPADALYFIRDGMVKISMYFPNGKEMILALFGKYDIFGELLLLQSERRPNQAEAVSDTTLIVLPDRPDFQRLLQQYPKIAMKFIQVMSTNLWRAEARFAEVGAYDAPGRLANLLLRLAGDFGVDGETRHRHRPELNSARLSLR